MSNQPSSATVIVAVAVVTVVAAAAVAVAVATVVTVAVITVVAVIVTSLRHDSLFAMVVTQSLLYTTNICNNCNNSNSNSSSSSNNNNNNNCYSNRDMTVTVFSQKVIIITSAMTMAVTKTAKVAVIPTAIVHRRSTNNSRHAAGSSQ